ncbi:hypothetical protein K8R43_01065 [archaeon]|nr:hypothetical protein [archaeon]
MGAKNTLLTLLILLSSASALSLTVNTPSNGEYFNIQEISFSVNAETNITAVTISINDTNEAMQTTDNTTWTYTTTLSDGYWSTTFEATNGTENITETITFYVDTISPAITILSPENSSYTETQLNFTYQDINLDSCFYSLNENTNQTISSNGTVFSESGTHHIELWCEDLASNQGYAQQWFTIEEQNTNQAPSITIVNPSGGTHQDMDEFTVKATDDTETSIDCKYQLDSEGWTSFNLNNNTEKTLTLDYIDSDGSHTIYVNCSDGNLTSQTSRSFTIDTEPPTDVTIEINDGDAETDSKEVTLTLHASGANKCRLSEDEDDWTDWKTSKNEDYDYTLSSGTGRKTVYYQCKDSVGNDITSYDSIEYTLCGNGKLDDGEECDGSRVRLGYICSSDCKGSYKDPNYETEISPPSNSYDSRSYPVSLKPTADNTSSVFKKMFNNSAEIYELSQQAINDLKLSATIKKEEYPLISLTGTYSGNQTLENLIIIFKLPESFASSSDDVEVITAAEVETLKELLYSVNFKNIKKGGSFSATFTASQNGDLIEIKNDIEHPTILAKITQTETPELLQIPTQPETTSIQATENQTEELEQDMSLVTGAIVLGSATLLVLGLVIVVLLAVVVFFLSRRKRSGARM